MLVAAGWQAICASRRVPVFSGLSLLCVLIQRNRFSLTYVMDTLIPSSRPPIRINFTDRRNNPDDEMRTHIARLHTAKNMDRRIGERADAIVQVICSDSTILKVTYEDHNLMTLGYQEEIVLYIVYSYNRGHNLLDPKICIKWLQSVSVYRCIYYNIYILIN